MGIFNSRHLPGSQQCTKYEVFVETKTNGFVDNVGAIPKFNWFLTFGTLDNSLLHVRTSTTCIHSCEHTPHARAPKLPTEVSMKQCQNVHTGTFAPRSSAPLNVQQQ